MHGFVFFFFLAWLTSGVREVLKGKKGSFHKWKFFPNEENKKEYKLWQKKCKRIQEAKKDFEESINKCICF